MPQLNKNILTFTKCCCIFLNIECVEIEFPGFGRTKLQSIEGTEEKRDDPDLLLVVVLNTSSSLTKLVGKV
jgi:hypothetical protein